MKRTLIALIACVLAAGAGASAAAADDSSPPSAGPSTQTVAQLAKNSQDADAYATSTQIKPENTNVSVPLFSKSDSGDVTQSNSSTAAAIAANANELDQTATQTAGGGSSDGGYSDEGYSDDGYSHDGYSDDKKPDEKGAPVQTAGQIAESDQDADAWADSTQVKPENTNVSDPVLSKDKGESGDVTQSNTSTALGVALNKNDTDQTATQAAGGGSPVQSAAQVAKSEQDADAGAKSTQIAPKNTNVSVRVFSPGDNGSVSQKNTSTAAAIAANKNDLDQTATQTAGGDKHDGSPKQTAGQVAVSKQDADAWAESKQVKPKNTNVSVRVFSRGDDGDVEQENTSTALGVALNKNDTDQTATQDAGGGSGVQAAEQIAKSDQDADASAESTQIKPKNTNVSVRVFSPGDNGKVSQKNSSKAIGIGANLNDLEQTTTQTAGDGKDSCKDKCGKDGAPVQTAGQVAISKQDADAWAESKQVKPKNTNVSARVFSKGDDGDVRQENTSTALGVALNKNDTDQTTTQTAGDGKDTCGDKCDKDKDGVLVQDAGQIAISKQDADAWAESKQVKPSNTNVSVDVLGKGHDKCHDTCDDKGDDKSDGGDVTQSNKSTAIALAANKNDTDQTVTQTGGSGYDTPVQAAGQIAISKQDADAWADSTQIKPSNTNISADVLGKDDHKGKDDKGHDKGHDKGDGGDVSQKNTSTAIGIAVNKNDTDQTVTQEQGGGYGDVAVQAAGQIALNKQDAWASAESKQIKPENTNVSVPLFGKGDDGDVSQRNSSTALAVSLNKNDLDQTVDQSQGDRKDGCPVACSAASGETDSLAGGLAMAKPDDDEDDSVSQANKSLAAALSLNKNDTDQTATQSQDGKGDVSVQAVGQLAVNKQDADAKAESFQYGASNTNVRSKGPDFCKQDRCKPKPEPCKHDCKPDWDRDKCKHDWDKHGCKKEPCDRKCEPRKPEPCKSDWKKSDHCKPRPPKCEPKRCKPDHDPCKRHSLHETR